MEGNIDRYAKKFFSNLDETKYIWIPLIILCIVLASVLAFVQELGSIQSFVLTNMILSTLVSLGIIYLIYKVTEIGEKERFSQLISVWILFMIVAVIAIVASDAILFFTSTSTSSAIIGLQLQSLSLVVFLATFCIMFLFFILLLYLILSFNFDAFFPFVCLVILIGVYIEYNQVVVLGVLNLVLALSIAFLIAFAIHSTLPEKERAAFRKIKLSPEKAAVIYVLALAIFFATYLIMGSGAGAGNTFLSSALTIINVFALAIILFIMVFLCALFWTKDAIVKWYEKG